MSNMTLTRPTATSSVRRLAARVGSYTGTAAATGSYAGTASVLGSFTGTHASAFGSYVSSQR